MRDECKPHQAFYMSCSNAPDIIIKSTAHFDAAWIWLYNEYICSRFFFIRIQRERSATEWKKKWIYYKAGHRREATATIITTTTTKRYRERERKNIVKNYIPTVQHKFREIYLTDPNHFFPSSYTLYIFRSSLFFSFSFVGLWSVSVLLQVIHFYYNGWGWWCCLCCRRWW